MEIAVKPLTNTAYGYPRGAKRRVTPVALACIHITGNSNTAADVDLHGAALDERNYANRDGSNGPSAHYYVARDGWASEAIDPVAYAAWSNGLVNTPNIANPGIEAVLALRAKGYNANEAYWLEIENVGYQPGYAITAAQVGFMAELIAAHAKRTGLPISRVTVHGHWEIDSVNRASCPNRDGSTGRHEYLLGKIIDAANLILNPPQPAAGPVGQVPVTDFEPKLMSTPAGLHLYDLSGQLVETLQNSYPERLSPYAVMVGGVSYRVSHYTSDGVHQVLLVKPEEVMVRDLPATYTKAQVDAARAAGFTEGYAAMKAKAVGAVVDHNNVVTQAEGTLATIVRGL